MICACSNSDEYSDNNAGIDSDQSQRMRFLQDPTKRVSGAVMLAGLGLGGRKRERIGC
jgi:hypothetical protein